MIFMRVNMSQSSHWIAEVDQHCRELFIPNLLLFMSRIRDWVLPSLVPRPWLTPPPKGLAAFSNTFGLHLIFIVYQLYIIARH